MFVVCSKSKQKNIQCHGGSNSPQKNTRNILQLAFEAIEAKPGMAIHFAYFRKYIRMENELCIQGGLEWNDTLLGVSKLIKLIAQT